MKDTVTKGYEKTSTCIFTIMPRRAIQNKTTKKKKFIIKVVYVSYKRFFGISQQ
jgi:hypothetical protein